MNTIILTIVKEGDIIEKKIFLLIGIILLILAGNLYANAQNTTPTDNEKNLKTSQITNSCQDCDQTCHEPNNCNTNENSNCANQESCNHNCNSQCTQDPSCQSTKNPKNQCRSQSSCPGTCNN